MEASVANDVGDGTPTEGATETTGGFDLSPVLERFDGLTPRFERLEQSVQSLLGTPEGETEGDEFDLASLFGDNEETERGGLDPKALQQLIETQVQARLDEKWGPLSEQVRSIQVGLDAEALTARYPELAKPEIAQPVVDAARELAEKAGNPELATNTKVLELIYKAQMADKYAAGEKPAGAEEGFDLERAGGAGPAKGDEPNIAERIIASRKNDEFWRFG